MTKIPISGSIVSTGLTCETRAMYGHHPAYNLEPNSLGPALTRGIIGHRALEIFYSQLMNGVNREVARKNVTERLFDKALDAMNEGDGFMTKMLGALAKLIDAYIVNYDDELDDFDILGVELKVEGDLPSPVASFVGRVDVVVKYKRGPWKGEVVPLDHKFLYNFWPENVFIMNAQMPNYIWAVRQMFPNEVVKRAVVNEVRHRENATERFRRKDIVPTRLEVQRLIENHSEAATRWAKIMMMPVEEARRVTTRNPTKFACQYCPFIRLCKAELLGEDTTLMIAHEFKPNSYGYAERDDEQ